MRSQEFDRPVVLVVEDEPIVLETVAVELQDYGFDVLRARSGEAALMFLETAGRIDLLMTDIGLPGAVDGWDLALRAREARPDIAVIYATGQSQDDPRRAPGSTSVTKPYRMRRLLDAASALGVLAPERQALT